jgi:LemA protein
MYVLFIAIIVVLVILLSWFVLTYNRFVSLRNRTEEAWSDIDVQLKRRYDLIPNLIETVKGYAGHEKELFERVAAARSMAMQAGSIKEKGEAENMLSSTLKSLFAVSENYPVLKASTNFLELQRELRDTEDKIQAARRFYNGNARDMNISAESFPANVVANILNIKKAEFFETEEVAKQAPKVQF